MRKLPRLVRPCLWLLLLAGCVSEPECAAPLNPDKLSAADIARVEAMLRKLEPFIKQKEKQGTIATLTFEELYARLEKPDQDFLRLFQSLDGRKLGIKLPFQGVAQGEVKLVRIEGQRVRLEGRDTEIPVQFLPEKVHARYEAMMQAMQQAIGKRLYVESGYRSSAYQLYLFVCYLKNHGHSIRETARFVALPGYSEHGAPECQAIDFISADGISGETDASAFEKLAEYDWLCRRAHEFGFVLSYPKNSPTGITFEPWHWRFEPAGGGGGRASRGEGRGASLSHPMGEGWGEGGVNR